MTAKPDLALRILHGDKQAEEDFVATYALAIRLIIEKRVRDRELAQDLTQETLVACLKRFRSAQLTDATKLSHYVHRTAVNQAANANRTKRVRATEAMSDFLESVESSTPDPFARLTTDARQQAVHQTLKELPVVRDREVLTRYFLLEQTKKEICEALDVTDRHFDRILYRAKKRFREQLETGSSQRAETIDSFVPES